jgi:hypothetical protein
LYFVLGASPTVTKKVVGVFVPFSCAASIAIVGVSCAKKGYLDGAFNRSPGTQTESRGLLPTSHE